MKLNNCELSKAIAFLRSCFAKRRWGYGERIPSLRTLASEAGVSFFSMWKAIQTLRKEGIVYVVRNKGIFASYPGKLQHSFINKISESTGIPEAAVWQLLCILRYKKLLSAKNFDSFVHNTAECVYSPRNISEIESGITQHTLIKKVVSELIAHGILEADILQKLESAFESQKDSDFKLPPVSNYFIRPEQGQYKPSYRWQRLLQQIECTILNGEFPSGSILPGLRELQYKYNVCYATLKKTLKALSDKGLILPYKKTYKVNFFNNFSTTPSKILVGIYAHGPMFYLLTQRAEEVLRTLEKESVHRNFAIEIIGFSLHNDSVIFFDRENRIFRDLPGNADDFIGYIFLENVGLPRVLTNILSFLSPKRRPIAVIDEAGSFTPLNIPAYPIKVFSIAISKSCGREIGRMLLSLGHEQVAFVSPYHTHLWSLNRLNGILEVYSLAGFTQGVKPYVQFLDSKWQYGSIVRVGWLDRIERFYESLRGRYSRTSLRTRDIIDKNFLKPASHQIANVREYIGIRQLLEQAISDKRTTALVCVNDNIGVAALEFLKEKKIKVPTDMSVVGFDDIQESFINGLSTYNFNFSNAAHLALSYIFKPDSKIFAGNNLFECNGIVVERASTGKARRC